MTVPRILSVAKALPPHYVEQDALLAAFRELWGQKHFNLERLEQLHRAVRGGGRHLAVPIGEDRALESFSARHAAPVDAAVAPGEDALRGALRAAGLAPGDGQQLFVVTL